MEGEVSTRLIIFLFLFYPAALYAKIGPVTWESLVDGSEIVALVKIKNIEVVDDGHGVTKVIIVDLLKGSQSSNEINVSWHLSTVSSALYDIHGYHLLFLKKTEDGKYKQSVIGRSFWKLYGRNKENLTISLETKDPRLSTIIELPSEFYKIESVPVRNCTIGYIDSRIVSYKKLKEYFNQ
tara:strand:+ start:164 stop:706 length:543 start_codon:yes stop_codon:yes gene_type:complete